MTTMRTKMCLLLVTVAVVLAVALPAAASAAAKPWKPVNPIGSQTDFRDGIARFVEWFREYYGK